MKSGTRQHFSKVRQFRCVKLGYLNEVVCVTSCSITEGNCVHSVLTSQEFECGFQVSNSWDLIQVLGLPFTPLHSLNLAWTISSLKLPPFPATQVYCNDKWGHLCRSTYFIFYWNTFGTKHCVNSWYNMLVWYIYIIVIVVIISTSVMSHKYHFFSVVGIIKT